MLPFALKVVWFVLCATGTLGSWFVLVAMAKALELFWFPVIFCIAITMLEGIVCLGMIYRMDPFEMPAAFRHVQIAMITFSALVLIGICVTFIIATTLSVLLPFRAYKTPNSTLAWRNWYYLPVVVIPVLCTIIQTVLVVRLNAADPSDNLHAEVTGHLWLMLLGYAGVPVIESIPCFFITILAAIRIIKMHNIEMEHRRRQYSRSTPVQSIQFSPSAGPSATSSQGKVPGRSSELPRSAASPSPHFHLPFRSASKSASDSPAWEMQPTPPHSAVVLDLTNLVDEEEKESPMTSHHERVLSQAAKEHDAEANPNLLRNGLRSDGYLGTTQPRVLPLLWRLILFHAVFFVIQVLIILSPLIDIGQKRQISRPFGTQHVALMLASWGPVIIFSHSPAVRKYIVFWE